MRRSFRRAYAVSSPGTALLRCAVGHSSRPSLAVAVQEAVQAATSGLARAPDLLFVYSSARGSAADVYGVVPLDAALLGRVSAHSWTDPHSTSVLAATLPPSVRAASFHVAEPMLPEGAIDLEAALLPNAAPTSFILLAAAGFDVVSHLAVLDAAFPKSVKAGAAGLADASLLGGGGVHERGAVGLVLTGEGCTLDVIVSHGAAVRGAIPITKSDPGRGLVHEMAGLPAADLLQRVAGLESFQRRSSGYDEPGLLCGTSPAPVRPTADEDDRARTGVGAGGAAARAPHTIVLGAAAELLAAGASADGDEAGDEADRSQALAGLRHSELLRRASKGQLGAATEQSVRFDRRLLPPGALDAGGELTLMQCDAALADEDLLVCAARYAHERSAAGAPPPAEKAPCRCHAGAPSAI